ncbi:MAG: PTS sugar transporter subunit IIA [Spirochaetaceae bacterium]|jgi:PTS system fructose-specific IIC component/PTS system nitrogen regulatory IIA component|nr:PTS sugar transporter subunit IIA [Spirochaetaceae bacterium]
MILSEIFAPEYIKIGLEAEEKDEAFEELADVFCQGSRLNIREDILGAVREREQKMSTGIQKGIAIPHGKTNAVSRVCGTLGISRRGIDYDALDGEPVYMLFMVIAPQTESEKHLRILKRLAELLQNPQFFTDLAAQTDSSAACDIIKKYEAILTTVD